MTKQKPGRKFTLALIWGVALMGVLLLFLAFGVRSDVILGAWLAAFVAIPTQFSAANAVITRKFAGTEGAKDDLTLGVPS